MIDESSVAERIDVLRQRIGSHGRTGVRIVAVTKGFGVDAWIAAVRAGCLDIGENYAQELVAKAAAFPSDVERPAVHFIGRLQTNKVRLVGPLVSWWHTVDRPSLIDELGRRCSATRVLVQVNATGEADKGGCHPSAVESLVIRSRERGLDPVGLMTVGPTDGDRTRTREAFLTCARLADQHGLAELSMGMSGDLDIALEAGATIIRVGSAIFGDRPPTA